MKLKKFFPFLLGGALVAATAAPIAGVVVSCSSSTPATDTFKANSGVINGVTTSGFKDVVSKLNLSNTTTLSTLTDDTLKNALSNTEYKDLTLTIQDGSSEVNGILRLKVTGSYNGKSYNDDITISNFNHLNDSFTVTDVKLNNDKWFQQGGAYTGSSSEKVDFGSSENINLIGDATFTTSDNSKLKWEDVKKDYQITAANWKINEAKDKLEDVKFTITQTKKEYKNGKWDVSDKKLEQKGSATISLPSFNDLLENVLDNVKFNDVSQYYASYFRGLFSYITKQNRNDILEGEASKKLFSSDISYLKNYKELENVKIIFSTDPNDYSADDVKGEFTLKKVKLSLNNSETKMRDISWDKFKKIPEKFERRYNKEITISNKNSSSDKKANYLWRLLGQALEDEIILVYNGQSESNNNLLTSDALKQKIIPTVSGNWWPKSCIYDSARPELVSSVGFDRVNKNFDNFSLLGSGRMEFGQFKSNVTSNKFDYDSGLLNFGKGIIQVESINLWANEMKNVRLAKTNDDSGSVELSFEVPIVITLVNNPNKIYQNTTFKTTFL